MDSLLDAATAHRLRSIIAGTRGGELAVARLLGSARGTLRRVLAVRPVRRGSALLLRAEIRRVLMGAA